MPLSSPATHDKREKTWRKKPTRENGSPALLGNKPVVVPLRQGRTGFLQARAGAAWLGAPVRAGDVKAIGEETAEDALDIR